MSNPVELRFKLEREPLTYLSMANGHSFSSECTSTDIARASMYACCYLWMLANPHFKAPPGFREEAREYAEWLLEPGTYRRITHGCRSDGAIDLEDQELIDWYRSFLHGQLPKDKEKVKLQVFIPRGLWASIKAAYNIKHGATNEGFALLMAALLKQAEALELPSEGDNNDDN